MAEVVTIAHGDSISRILKNKRGVKEHEINTWLRKLRTINPHISNLDHIYPGERVLIPNTSHEMISDDQVWQNAFSRIPRALEFPHDGHTQLFWATAGTTIRQHCRAHVRRRAPPHLAAEHQAGRFNPQQPGPGPLPGHRPRVRQTAGGYHTFAAEPV